MPQCSSQFSPYYKAFLFTDPFGLAKALTLSSKKTRYGLDPYILISSFSSFVTLFAWGWNANCAGVGEGGLTGIPYPGRTGTGVGWTGHLPFLLLLLLWTQNQIM